MPNTDYTDYTDNRVVYIIFEVNVSVGCPQLASTASTKYQGIKVGKEAHQDGYYNNRYLDNSFIHQQTFSPEKYPGYYSDELYIILITYPPKVQ